MFICQQRTCAPVVFHGHLSQAIHSTIYVGVYPSCLVDCMKYVSILPPVHRADQSPLAICPRTTGTHFLSPVIPLVYSASSRPSLWQSASMRFHSFMKIPREMWRPGTRTFRSLSLSGRAVNCLLPLVATVFSGYLQVFQLRTRRWRREKQAQLKGMRDAPQLR